MVVLAVGDRAGLFGNGTSGEGCDAEDLHLPGHQPKLVEAIFETGRPTVGVTNLDPTPAFPFGHGVSYTSFRYDNLRVSAVELDTAGSVELTVTVENTGAREGDEVVQLYVEDPVASVTRPVTQLVGFARVDLAAGASAEVSFTVHTDRLSFTGRTLERIVEPGQVTFRVGTAADTFAGPVSVQLVGPTRIVRGGG